MTASALTIVASGAWWQRTIGYKIMGNEIWRFLLILVVVMVAMAAGKIIQFGINTYTSEETKNAA